MQQGEPSKTRTNRYLDWTGKYLEPAKGRLQHGSKVRAIHRQAGYRPSGETRKRLSLVRKSRCDRFHRSARRREPHPYFRSGGCWKLFDVKLSAEDLPQDLLISFTELDEIQSVMIPFPIFFPMKVLPHNLCQYLKARQFKSLWK